VHDGTNTRRRQAGRSRAAGTERIPAIEELDGLRRERFEGDVARRDGWIVRFDDLDERAAGAIEIRRR
jgi:hypothetical protein